MSILASVRSIAWKESRPWLLLSPALAIITFFLVIPACFIVVYSFWLRTAIGTEEIGFYLDNWKLIFGDPFYRDVLVNTFGVAFITTIVCAIAGYVPAHFVAFSHTRHKDFLLLLLIVPFWISYIIRTMSWMSVLGSEGIVNTLLLYIGVIDDPLHLLYSRFAVVLGLVQYLLPFMILNIYVSLNAIDKDMIDAAKSLGCNWRQAFKEVTFPLSLPGLGAGCLLCFVLASGNYITPLILGGPDDLMFANLVYATIVKQLNFPMGAALSVVLLILLGVLVTVYTRYLGVDQLAKSFR